MPIRILYMHIYEFLFRQFILPIFKSWIAKQNHSKHVNKKEEAFVKLSTYEIATLLLLRVAVLIRFHFVQLNERIRLLLLA
ncbi:hypothetical protein T08_11493 [Trichinella sp. T8]|nr:hypothetical protein T08_11493 [Trichinella sp. T8]